MSTTPKRKQIREALKTLLLNQTDAEARVYTNRVSAFWKSEFPCISIFNNDEASTPRNIQGIGSIRQGTLTVQIIDEANEGLDDTLDKIADQVEAIIDANLSLSGTVQSIILQNTEIELNTEPQTAVGSLTLVYEIQYLK